MFRASSPASSMLCTTTPSPKRPTSSPVLPAEEVITGTPADPRHGPGAVVVVRTRCAVSPIQKALQKGRRIFRGFGVDPVPRTTNGGEHVIGKVLANGV